MSIDGDAELGSPCSSRNLNVVSSSYPEVVEALAATFRGRARIVLDGEMVALGAGGRPSFGQDGRQPLPAPAFHILPSRTPERQALSFLTSVVTEPAA